MAEDNEKKDTTTTDPNADGKEPMKPGKPSSALLGDKIMEVIKKKDDEEEKEGDDNK